MEKLLWKEYMEERNWEIEKVIKWNHFVIAKSIALRLAWAVSLFVSEPPHFQLQLQWKTNGTHTHAHKHILMVGTNKVKGQTQQLKNDKVEDEK